MQSVVSIVLNNFKNDSRVLKEALSLTGAGHEVTIQAYHDEGLSEREVVSGVNVQRMKLVSKILPKARVVQLFKYIEFVIRAAVNQRHQKIFHCNDLNALPVAFLVKKVFRKDIKIVYDAHEYETETNGLKGLEKTLTKWVERFLINYCDQVITVSDSIANEYSRLYEIPKPALVLNAPYLQSVDKQNRFREKFGISEDKVIFLYQGGLFKGRGVETVIDAFKSIKIDNAVVVFMGYGPLESYVKNASNQYSNVYFHEAVSPTVLLNYTASADFGICMIEDTSLSYRYCLPNKMFEYVMAGLPIIASNLYEMRRFVEECEVGVIASQNTANGLVEAIEAASQINLDLLASNIEVTKQVFNWEQQEKVLLDVYSSLGELA